MISVHGISNKLFFLVNNIYLSKINVSASNFILNHLQCANLSKEALELINECLLISD